ncbi:MAG TPA: periplasmic heavy metal sensor [Rhizomicrobium sp.]|nr:periplasmic heavy metal sensor [Rhizomicrobium sp.]
MKIVTKLLIASAMGLLFAQPVSAQPAHGGMGHMGRFMHDGGSPFMMLLKSANLTEAQRQQVHEILKSEHTQMKSVYQQFHAVHEQIADKLLSTGNVSASELAPLEQKAAKYQQEIDQNMVTTALAIRGVLTSDQISRLAQVHQQLKSLHSQIQSILGSDQPDSGDQTN